MGIYRQQADVRWHPNNRAHYEAYGYEFTEYGDWVTVDVGMVKHPSKAHVVYECDICGKKENITLWHAERRNACTTCSYGLAERLMEKRKRERKG